MPKRWFGLAGLLAAALPGSVAPQSAVAITHVTVVDGGDSIPRYDQTVLFRGDRIESVGPARSIAVPATARVIDGRGMFLLPGFWDMHVHTSIVAGRELLKLFLANGVTGVRDMAGDWDTLRLWRREIAAGRMPGPRIVASGPYLEGGDVPIPHILTRTPDEGRTGVDSLAALGVDFIKVHSQLNPATYFAIARRARERGMVFAGHVSQAVGAAAASDSGQRSIEHLLGIPAPCSPADSLALRPRYPVQGALGRCSSADLAPLYAKFARNGTWVTPTFTAQYEVAVWPERAVPGDSLAHYLPDAVRRLVAEIFPMPAGIPAGADSVGRAMLGRRLAQVSRMRQAGVHILTGTDAPLRNSPPGFGLHEEFVMLRQGGLSPFEIIQAATLEPAGYLGIADSAGKVAPGMRADLVLLADNPLLDIRNTRRIVAVVAAGRVYQGAERELLLRGQQTRYGSCGATAGPAADWAPALLGTIGVSFLIPPGLRAREYSALRGIARRAKVRSIPGAGADGLELVAAWEASRGSTSTIGQLLLYSRSSDLVPAGRPCAMNIGRQSGLIFRTAFSGEGKAADDYWIEAYWPGFLLAGGGASMETYSEIFRILGSVTAP